MSLREWMNNNSAVATIIAVLLLVFALAVVIWQVAPSGAQAGDVYFYDPSTDELFTLSSDNYPPVETPSGGTDGLRAHVFACGGNCPENLADMTPEQVEDETEAFVAYFERYPQDAKEALESGEDSGDDGGMYIIQAMQQSEIRAVDGSNWHSGHSTQGASITRQVHERDCPSGQRAEPCRPQ